MLPQTMPLKPMTLLDRAIVGLHGLTPYAFYPASLAGKVPANLIEHPVTADKLFADHFQASEPVTSDGSVATTLHDGVGAKPDAQVLVRVAAGMVAKKKTANIPQWAKDIGIMDIKFATLRDNPEKAKEFFAVLYKNCWQFNPIKNFMQQIMENPLIQVPESYKESSPDYELVMNGKGEVESLQYRYKTTKPQNPNEPTEEVKRWLDQATFLDAYNDLFGTDLEDSILHPKSYQAYRYTGLILGAASWLIPFGIAATAAVNEGGITIPPLEDLLTNPPTLGLFLLSGASTLISPFGGAMNSPFAKLLQGASFLAQKINNVRLLDLATPVGDFFQRDPINYFAAKHLSTKRTIWKYVHTTMLRFKTGVIWELYKDVPEPYKWYRVLTKGYDFAKGSITGKSGKDLIDNERTVAPGLVKYLPKTNRLIEAAMMYGLTVPFSVLAVVNSGETNSSAILSSLGATAMLVGASTVVKTYFDRIKKENLMEALTYDQIVGFSGPLFSLMSSHFAVFQNPLVYGAGLAGYILTTIGAGWFIHQNSKTPEDAEQHTTRAM